MPKEFTYRGVFVVPMDRNSYGLRYKVAYGESIPVMRTETKQDMKDYIKEQLKKA
jgi:hypothetical protein